MLFVGMGPIKVLVYYLTAIHDATPSVGRRVAFRAVATATITALGLLVVGATLMQLLHFSGEAEPTNDRHSPPRRGRSPMLRQVAEGVLIHQSELLQNNTVVVQGRAGVLLIDPGIHGRRNGLPRERPSRVGPARCGRLLDAS